MSSCKRPRGENFSEEDKMVIIQYVKDNAEVLEAKKFDPFVNKKKNALWAALASRLHREATMVKKVYSRLKQSAKTTIAAHRKSLKQTGGGRSDQKEPTDIDWFIYDICPVDFEDDISEFDSDSRIKTIVTIPPTTVEKIHFLNPANGLLEALHSSPAPPESSRPLPNSPTIEKPTRKRKSNMSSFEHEMLLLNEKKINAAIESAEMVKNRQCALIDDQRALVVKQTEYEDLRCEAKRLKIEYYKKMLQNL